MKNKTNPLQEALRERREKEMGIPTTPPKLYTMKIDLEGNLYRIYEDKFGIEYKREKVN